jgi:uncharacterized membrane protein YdjX (TVP38/TMEM64 family)
MEDDQKVGTMKRPLTLRHLIKIVALVLLVFGTYLAVQWVDFREVLKPDRVAAYLNSTGPFAPLVFIILMAASVVISPIPSLPLDLAAGATFGVLQGTAYSVIGAEIGAILSFLIGRALGREVLVRLFRTDITFCERCSDRHLAIFVFASRLLPIFSFDLISYGAGLTNMSVRAFAVATLIGMIPPTFALTALGGSVFAGEWLLLLLGLAMVAFFLLVPKLVMRYQSSGWAQLLLGKAPAMAPVETPPAPKSMMTDEPLHRCSACGGLME